MVSNLKTKYQSQMFVLKNWDSDPKSQSKNLLLRGESLKVSLKIWYHYPKSLPGSEHFRLRSPRLSLTLHVKTLVLQIPALLHCFPNNDNFIVENYQFFKIMISWNIIWEFDSNRCMWTFYLGPTYIMMAKKVYWNN